MTGANPSSSSRQCGRRDGVCPPCLWCSPPSWWEAWGVVMTRSPFEEPTVPRPARLPAPMVKVALPEPIVVEAAVAPVKPLERKPRPPSDLLGERL